MCISGTKDLQLIYITCVTYVKILPDHVYLFSTFIEIFKVPTSLQMLSFFVVLSWDLLECPLIDKSSGLVTLLKMLSFLALLTTVSKD